MRLATLKDNSVAIITSSGAVSLRQIGFSGNMLDLILAGNDELSRIKQEAMKVNGGEKLQPDSLSAPLKNPPKIVAIGLNYSDHASETGMEVPKSPLIFAKFSSSITGSSEPIIIPGAVTRKVDYEAELGVIIGKRTKNVLIEDSLDCVFGYTIINDISARDIQFADKQWTRGKSLDTFCPMGPVVVTKDEIPNPQDLELGCEVNGEILQQSSTKFMIFSVAELISLLSNSFTFEPGDIIATGTPGGVGYKRNPPVYLKNGDTIRTWITGIGEMINPVVSDDADQI